MFIVEKKLIIVIKKYFNHSSQQFLLKSNPLDVHWIRNFYFNDFLEETDVGQNIKYFIEFYWD